ncbi:hypothetical protein [Streptomyces sp. BH055]|uniref:hypothetical protein n=1 Tax=Streptomyces sp. BH055 TaxID=3401173 RepID=UPI003BB567B7
MFNLAARTATTRRRVGRLCGWGLILAALAFSGIGGMVWLNDSGRIGAHGTLTVDHCYEETHSSGSGRHSHRSTSWDCRGTFRSDDGSITDGEAAVSGAGNQAAGAEIYVQGTKGWGYGATETNEGTVFLGFAFLGLTPFALGLFCVRTGYWLARWCTIGARESWRTTLGTSWRVLLVALVAVSVVGFTVCLVSSQAQL